MIKAFMWFLFILHTLVISTYILLGLFHKVEIKQLNLILLSISGILTTMSFSEIVLRELHENRKKDKR